MTLLPILIILRKYLLPIKMINKNINNYTFLTLLFLFLFLQLSFIPQLFSGRVVLDLIPVLLIVASFFYRSSDIFYISFFCGFIVDTFSGVGFGFTIISILLSVFISSYLSYYYLKELFSLNMFSISFTAVVVYNVAYFVLMNAGDFNQIMANLSQLLPVIAFETVYTLFLVYPLAYILSYKK